MIRIVLLFLALLSVSSLATAGDEPRSVTPAVLAKRVPPRYPAKAVDRGQEGWVDLSFSITPEGSTSDIKVVASFPRGVFDRSAINALAKWIYSPRLENGAPVPQPDNHAVLSFALSESASIRPPLAPVFASAQAQIAARHFDSAGRTLREIAHVEGLSLYELAALEQLRGRMAFATGSYGVATDCFARALAITGRFDAETRAGISEKLVMAAINGRQFARALQAFDAWDPPDTPQFHDLRRTVETIRSAIASGRPIDMKPPASP